MDQGDRSVIAAAGRAAIDVAQTTGMMLRVTWGVLVSVVTLRVPLRELFRQVYACGAACLPVTIMASICSGAIVAVQGMDYVRKYSAPAVYGWAAYFSAVREVGPLLLGITLSARLGAFHAAQLGALSVTDRVDAMKALGVNPMAVMVAPRVLAMPFAAVMLMAWSDAVSLSSATVFAWVAGGVTPWTTWASIQNFSLWSDLVLGLQKAGAYGFFAGVTATGMGLGARGGADAVGTQVMRSAVASLLVITAVNHALVVWTAP